MANTKVSAMTDHTNPVSADLLYVVNGSNHRKATLANVLSARFMNAVKAADQSKTSDATPAEDGDLSLTLRASTLYCFECNIIYSCTDTSGPGSGFTYNMYSSPNETNGGYLAGSVAGAMTALRTDTDVTVAKSSELLRIFGYIETSGSATTFSLYWSQANSHADNSTLHLGSFLKVWANL